MDITIRVNGVDLTAWHLSDQTRLNTEISGRVSTFETTFRLAAASVGSVTELDPVEVKDQSNARRFAGTVTKLSRSYVSEDLVDVNVTCSDFTPELDATAVVAATFTGQSDRAIIKSLFSTYKPGFIAVDANIAVIATVVPTFTVKDSTLKQTLDDLCKITGGDYYIDSSAAIHYFDPAAGSASAPFALSTNPADGTPEYALTDYSLEFSKCINSCTLLGGVVGGSEVRVTYEDPTSISAYGKHSYTIVDRDVLDGALGILKAKAVVEQNAFPRETARATLYTDGLEVGQIVEVTHDLYGLSAVPLLVRSVEISWDQAGTVWTAELGDPPKNTERLIAAIDARTQASKSVPTTIPGAGTVTDASIAPGGLSASSIGAVNASSITGLISAGQIASVNAGAILGTLSSSQIGTINASSISGAIAASQIASVNASSINGVIVSSQVANDLIDSLSKLAPALRPIPQIAVDPTLPDANFPEGSVILNTASGQYRKVVSGAWTTVTESTAIAGKFSYALLGSIKASSITGLIAASQIGTITAGRSQGNSLRPKSPASTPHPLPGASRRATSRAASTQGRLPECMSEILQKGGSGYGYLDVPGLIAGGSLSENLIQNGSFESGLGGWQSNVATARQPDVWAVLSRGRTGSLYCSRSRRDTAGVSW
jgi:hypothetical protein